MVLREFFDSIYTKNHTINIIVAFGIFELIMGIANELSSIIFKGDSITIPGFNGEFHVKKFMNKFFTAIFSILLVVIYKYIPTIKTGGKKNKKHINKKKFGGKKKIKKIKFVKSAH